MRGQTDATRTTKKRWVAPPGQAVIAYPSDATHREVPQTIGQNAPRIFNSMAPRRISSPGSSLGGSHLSRDTSHTAICHYLDVPPFISYPARGTIATATANHQSGSPAR